LQQQSKRLNLSTVSTVLEKAPRIPSADRRDRLTDHLDQGFAAASFGFGQDALNLGKSLLDRIEVG
jgi:hypothetical protein